MMSFTCAYPYTFLITIPLILLELYFRFWHCKGARLQHSLVAWYQKFSPGVSQYPAYILRTLRLASLIGLAFLVARPQWIDYRSHVTVNGIDVVLCLDVSGSMEMFDDLRDRRSRIDVSKQEALSFIDRRVHDPIGIVIFGADAMTLCPLTIDKGLLKGFVANTRIGVVDPNGTKLFTGIATAIGRLRKSTASSKIVVVLTDGKPMGETRFDADTITAMAKEFGVKLYTIGIGNKEGGYAVNAFGMLQAVGAESIDHVLLATLARETGGKFFVAQNPAEMKEAYDMIDRLEKTTYETALFGTHHEAFLPFLIFILLCCAAELLLSCFIWRGFFS